MPKFLPFWYHNPLEWSGTLMTLKNWSRHGFASVFVECLHNSRGSDLNKKIVVVAKCPGVKAYTCQWLGWYVANRLKHWPLYVLGSSCLKQKTGKCIGPCYWYERKSTRLMDVCVPCCSELMAEVTLLVLSLLNGGLLSGAASTSVEGSSVSSITEVDINSNVILQNSPIIKLRQGQDQEECWWVSSWGNDVVISEKNNIPKKLSIFTL